MNHRRSTHLFDLLVRKDDREIRMAKAALLFASDHCEELKVRFWLGKLEALARRVGRLNARSPEAQVKALRTVLAEEEGYRGNTEDYDDPRNSLLNEVIERRTGLPILLSVVWLDVAGQLGWPFAGVGLPGHFIIKCETPGEALLVDPFSGGNMVSREDCVRLVQISLGKEIAFADDYFQSTPTKLILARMLNNLQNSFLRRQDWVHAACVINRLLALELDTKGLEIRLRAVMEQIARLN